MPERTSRAIAIQNFIDRIQVPKTSNQPSVLQAIATSFNLGPESAELKFLLRVQQENFEGLLLEIELSDMEDEARKNYRKQVGELAKLIEYPALYQKADAAKKEIISPNYNVLAYVNDKLRIYAKLIQSHVDDISTIVSELDRLYQEILDSNLDVQLKATVASTISNLVLLLKNYRVLGFEKARDMASASMMTLYVASTKVPKEDAGLIRRVAAKTMMVVGIIATIDASLTHSTVSSRR